MEAEEDEEEEEDAGEGVGGGGEVRSDDETLGEGLPLLSRLWRLEEVLAPSAPTARGMWLGGRCSPPPPLLTPPGRLPPPCRPPPAARVKDSEEEDTPSGCLGESDGTAV